MAASLTVLGLALQPGVAAADDAAAEPITVTATKSAQSVFEVPATVSVITDEQIADQLADDIKDLVRFEPGVSVRQSPARFSAALSTTGRDGASGFNIRGLEGNRVLIQVDGIRAPDAFSFGAQSVGRGDYADLDLLKSVEILRGPASALYGSDGLAGAVSFITKDPEDYLQDDRHFGARARVGYASADDSRSAGFSGAFRAGAFSALLAYTRREGHELDNQGTNNAIGASRTTPVPQDAESNAVLGKLVFTPSDAHRVRFTWDHLERNVDSNVLTAVSASTAALLAQDETERDRYSLDYRYDGDGVIDGAQAAIYYQNATTRQYSAEDRTTLADRIRDNTFDNEVWGLSAQAESAFAFAGAEHAFVYGGDYSQTRQEGIRTGTIPPVGETYPTRSFPNTDYTLAGVFVQDTITLFDGALDIVPAIRYDSYELTPERDALYVGQLAPQEDDHVSPKIGVVFWASEQFGFFANYAEGFKAPSPSQVNNGFANPVQNYTALPNPNLKPETSTTFEAGARMRNVAVLGGALTASAAAFTGRYDDFIEQVQVSGSFTALDPAVYQFVNLGEVDITGAEARMQMAWDSGFTFNFALSTAQGEQRRLGVETPLLSIDPVKVVGGVGYRDPAGRFGGQLSYTHADRKKFAEAGGSYRPPAFGLVDLTAYWSPVDFATLRLGAFNLLDEDYAWWSDVRGLSPTSTVIDAYTQPGRNVSVSLTVRY
jgi:hemoglobin/transferrin/lactoferrin receptor protein